MPHSDKNNQERKSKKKTRRSRSRSRSPALHSERRPAKHKSKKSKRAKYSRSRSKSPQYRRNHRSRSKDRSRSHSHDRKSRSTSYDRRSRSPHRRHRSKSTGRSRPSPSSHRRSRSSSTGSNRYYKNVSSHSKNSSHRNTPDVKEKKNMSFADGMDISHLPPQEQAKIRIKQSIEAAIASEEKSKAFKHDDTQSVDAQARFQHALVDIDSDSFNPASFMSSRSNPKPKSEIGFGTSSELILGPAEPTKITSTESYAHPNLKKDPQESLNKWIVKLTSIRQRLLKGTAT